MQGYDSPTACQGRGERDAPLRHGTGVNIKLMCKSGTVPNLQLTAIGVVGLVEVLVLVGHVIVGQCGALGGVAEGGLGCNGYDAASTTGLSMVGAFVVEIVLTCVFVLTILGVTADGKTSHFGGLVIGLTLTFVHTMGIPLTGTSVNPARSFGPALAMAVTGNTLALEQVWVFIFAPLAGAALAAAIFKGFKSFYGSEA